MPFNGAGVFTLAEPAFVPNTTIVAADMNSDLSDIATGLSTCLTTDGQSTMTAGLKGFAGSVSLPGYTFSSDLNTGMYRIASDNIGITCGGTKILDIASTGLGVTGNLTASGNLAITGTSAFTGAVTLPAATVTLANMANLTHGRFIGRLSAGDGVPQASIIPFGQCRLAKVSTNLVLSPHEGNLLTIDSAVETIPDAGVTLAVGALSNTTLYYIYAYMNAGTMTLEASTTTTAVQAGTGILIKNADATRTFVGLAYLVAGAFVDSAATRYVRSWFNDPGVTFGNAFTANRTTTSTSYVEINTEIRVSGLFFADDLVQFTVSGSGENSGGGSANLTSIGIDGTTPEDTFSRLRSTAGGQASGVSCSVSKIGLSVGLHYATLLGKVTADTGTWEGSATAANRTVLTGFAKRSP